MAGQPIPRLSAISSWLARPFIHVRLSSMRCEGRVMGLVLGQAWRKVVGKSQANVWVAR